MDIIYYRFIKHGFVVCIEDTIVSYREIPMNSPQSVAADGSGRQRPFLSSLKTGLLFGVLGFVVNWFKLELFFNVDFLFGSIITMFALLRHGLAAGAIAALVAAACTWHHWHHPWAIIIFTAEAVFAGLLVQRRRWELLSGVVLFWFTAGLLLVWYFYCHLMGLTVPATLLIALKQGVNGIFNTLVAMGIAIAVNSRDDKRDLPSVYQLLFVSMALFVMVPAMGYVYADIQKHLHLHLDNYRQRTARTAEVAEHSVSLWLDLNRDTVMTLAGLAGSAERANYAEMQRAVEIFRSRNSEFRRVGIFDKDAVTRAFSPLIDETGASTIGIDLSARGFNALLRSPPHPFVYDVDLGVIGTPRPRLILLAPIVTGNDYRGAAFGIVDFSVLRHLLDEIVSSRPAIITVMDQKGRVVISTDESRKPLDVFSFPAQGTITQLPDGVGHWIPDKQQGSSNAKRWFASFYFKEIPLTLKNGWKVVVQISLRPQLEEIGSKTSKSLGMVAFLVMTIIMLSRLFAARFSSTLRQLNTATQKLPQRISSGEQIAWPAPAASEMAGLVANFQVMEQAIKSHVAELETLNKSLEQRVVERRQELRELNRDFVSFLENTTDFVYYKDGNSRFRFCSQTLAEITGHASWRDMIGKHDLEVFPEDTARIYHEEELPIFRDGAALLNRVDPFYDAQGEKGWVSTNKWPVFDGEHRVIGIFGISRDITGQQNMLRAMQEGEKRLNLALSASKMGVWEWDLQTNGVIWSPECYGVVGLQDFDGSFASFAKLLHPEDEAHVLETVEKALAEQRLYTDEFRIIRPDGELRWLSNHGKATYDDSGKPLLLIGTVQDITERKRMESDMQQALESARNSTDTMSRLLRTVAHEFRTPLGLLTISSDILDRYWERLSRKEQIEQNEQIRSAANQLANLIDSVISFNQRGTDTSAHAPIWLDIDKICRDIVAEVETVWGEGQACTVSIAPECGAALLVEPLFRRILGNLLTNAFRYTPAAGTVSLYVRREANRLLLEVADTGIGIPYADLQRIFDAFYRSSNVEGRRGLGLGLSIVQEAVTQMGGTIAVMSEVGTGTVMRVEVPVG